ncbi:hypothetical protein HU200_046483 [Digitaria exilis]|uniref:Homeobox domain-containing protein n=1 Tax=Digitaria exilis TaxID=1010633 RepID=A0A835AY14_9POAL|nr:hypothetical protein HU200_046483 [Digitaria exilis]CAB3445597.1 unnamed protein product [Digitaria exilis]
MSSLTSACSAEERGSVEEFGAHLSLGIGAGGGSNRPSPPQQKGRPPRTVQLFGEVLSLLQDADDDTSPPAAASSRRKRDRGGSSTVAAAVDHLDSSRQSKKARKSQSQQGDDGDRRSPTDDGDGGGGRKKLRLTAAQAALLEDTFRAHNILSHAEKQELARRVGLSARQVEVWFQNRRARTKLKQTEVDCELLRRWCDRLTDENARLRRDLADLRRASSAAVCAACRGGGGNNHVAAARAGETA